MRARSITELLDIWRLMKVKHGDCHTGSINKMAIIDRFGLTRSEVNYPGPKGGLDKELFASIRGSGRVFTMRQLKDIATRKRSDFDIVFKIHDRRTGKVETVSEVKYSTTERAAA